MRLVILIILFLTIFFYVNAQNVSSCLSESQLIQLQTLSIDEVNDFMKSYGWNRLDDNENHTDKFFGYLLDYSVSTWQNKGTKFIEGIVCLYYKAGKPNLIGYHNPDDVCFNNLIKNLSGVSLLKKNKNNIVESSSFINPGGVILDFQKYENDNTSLRFSLLIYNESSINAQIQAEKARIAAIIKAESDRKETIKIANHTGDSLFLMGKFEEAITQYIYAKQFLKKEEKNILIELESDIQKSQKNKNRVIIENSIAKGDTLYNLKQFNDALVNYENALSFYYSNSSSFNPDLVNSKIKPKIESVKANLDALSLQKTYQSYLSLNPKEFYSFRDRNYKTIDSIITKIKRSGYMGYRSVVKFDINGTNLSYLKIDSSSNKKINVYLNNIKFSGLVPTKKLNYYIPSIDEVSYKVSWSTYNLRINSKSYSTQTKPDVRSTEDYNFKIKGFINNQNYNKGKFKFEVVEKKLNDKIYNDITLIKYRNNNGPINSAYSLILPGWGTLKVSDGNKGKGRMTLFLLSTAISAGCKIYSNNEYNKFIESNGSSTGEDHYNNANIANQAFLVSGGIAASIYIYDFIWVFRKGIKNVNLSKAYKNNIKEKPIKVIVSPIKPL
jgi:hypothetical protein